jgi:hypothetical protein
MTPAAAVPVSVLCAILVAQVRPVAHWPDGTLILVWIDTRTATSGADALVERAMTTWTQAAGGHFTLEKTAARNAARVRVDFVCCDAYYGETRPRIDRRTGMIDEAEVHINRDVAGDTLDRQIILYLTALHELGHALGLPHTDDFSTIMYSFRRPDDGERYFRAYRMRLRSMDDVGSARATGLAPADLAALRALYSR